MLPPLLIASLIFSDFAVDLALGPNNTAFVTGLAYSSNFPTTPGVSSGRPKHQHDAERVRSQVRHYQKRGRVAGLFDLPGRCGLQFAVMQPGRWTVIRPTASTSTRRRCLRGGPNLLEEFSQYLPHLWHGNNQGAANINNGFVSELNSTGTKLIYSCFIHGSDGAPASGSRSSPVALRIAPLTWWAIPPRRGRSRRAA